MKEAIANAGVFNLVIIFVIILLAFFIGSLSYSKAFKVKNKIIEEIEKDQGYTIGVNDSTEGRSDKAKCGKYYRVITYMYFDIPIISQLLRLPVSGETMIFNEVDS